jgi:DNA-binding MarR family transcriptional regulator
MTTPSTLHPRERGSVRATDPDTSQWAADSITDTTTSQAVVLIAIRDKRLVMFTLSEIVDATKVILSPSRARTAVRELQDKGLIEETGEYALTPSGRRARLLTLTKQGRAAA